MFLYKYDLVRRVRIHPQYCGGKNDHPHKMVRKMLEQDIRENFFDKEIGYIVDLVSVTKIGEGFCLPLVGYIEFLVTFEAILFYPVIGELVNAVVETVTDTCIIFRHVCAYGVVRSYCLNEDDQYKYEEVDVVPDDEKQNKGTFKEGQFRSETNAEKVIAKGTALLLRITRRTLGGNGFFLIGSMSAENLGPLAEPDRSLEIEAPAEDQALIPALFREQDGSMPTFDVGEDIIPSVERAKLLKERLFVSKDTESDIEDAASVSSLKPE